jgi:hypothetical protein
LNYATELLNVKKEIRRSQAPLAVSPFTVAIYGVTLAINKHLLQLKINRCAALASAASLVLGSRGSCFTL